MKKIKKFVIFIIFLSIISLQVHVFADDEFDEEFDFSGLNEFLQEVDSEVNSIPQINSRHAIVYDRATRRGVIWKKGE